LLSRRYQKSAVGKALGDHIADAVEHAVRCEQIHEPLGVQGSTLAIVVGLQDDREVGLLMLGQAVVGERQPGRQDRAWSGRVAADAWPARVLPASAATVGTAARVALRARNERRLAADMPTPG
jgi:hypothetical protein